MTSLRSVVCLAVVLGCGGDKDTETEGAGATSTASSTGSSTSSSATSATGSPTSPTTTGDDTTSTAAASTSAPSTGDQPPPNPDSTVCPLDWSGPTTIAGEAPFGAFSGTVAWFEWQFCNGYYPLVLVVEDPADVQGAVEGGTAIPRAVAFSLPAAGWDHSAMTGEFTPEVYALVDGEWTDVNLSQGHAFVGMSVSVVATESPTDVLRIVGNFAIQGGQGAWDLEGSFDAAYCGPLNDFKPMNCD